MSKLFSKIPLSSSLIQFRGWMLFFCGICMGTADLVPGISGGTIAFILGFYQPLLESLQTLNLTAFRCLLTGKWKEMRHLVAWKFLFTLLAGILVAFICFANLFHWILSHEVYRIYLYAAFSGFILASFAFCIRQIKVWNSQNMIGLCLGALIAFLLTDATLASSVGGEFAAPVEIPYQEKPLSNYDYETHLMTGLSAQELSILISQGILQKTTPVYNQQHLFVGLAGDLAVPEHFSFFNGWLVLCGALAICALLLPGISGSYILTLLGVYPLVIEALVECLNNLAKFSFPPKPFAILLSLGIGIGIGALAFARLLNKLLRDYPHQSLSILSGFMIGAIRSVWPFWSYEYAIVPVKFTQGPQLIVLQPLIPSVDSPLIWQAALFALGGFVFVMALDAYITYLKGDRRTGS